MQGEVDDTMLVKICGIQTIESAQVAVESGADLIGFVFAPSKRQITPEKAAQIAAILPTSIKKVGVFVNDTQANIKTIAEHVGLDLIQLHGDETPEFAEQLPYETIKAFSIDNVHADTLKQYNCQYYIIDSPPTTYRGGSGETFDWQLTAGLNINPNTFILAGGLSADNIQQAIQAVRPAGVDVSSGVETAGQKDHDKIKQFIANAKG